MLFADRQQAASRLAKSLSEFRGQPVVVFALPRGGVVLGRVIADSLGAPLDLLIPRKIGHPTMPEYAIAAVSESGDVVANKPELQAVDEAWFERAVAQERNEARRRRMTYLAGREPVDVKGKTAIIVDDGIATGLTIRAAIADLKRRQPSRVVVAVPVAPPETVDLLSRSVDRLVILEKPDLFMGSIGQYYETFDQVSDDEVVAVMSAR